MASYSGFDLVENDLGEVDPSIFQGSHNLNVQKLREEAMKEFEFIKQNIVEDLKRKRQVMNEKSFLTHHQNTARLDAMLRLALSKIKMSDLLRRVVENGGRASTGLRSGGGSKKQSIGDSTAAVDRIGGSLDALESSLCSTAVFSSVAPTPDTTAPSTPLPSKVQRTGGPSIGAAAVNLARERIRTQVITALTAQQQQQQQPSNNNNKGGGGSAHPSRPPSSRSELQGASTCPNANTTVSISVSAADNDDNNALLAPPATTTSFDSGGSVRHYQSLADTMERTWEAHHLATDTSRVDAESFKRSLVAQATKKQQQKRGSGSGRLSVDSDSSDFPPPPESPKLPSIQRANSASREPPVELVDRALRELAPHSSLGRTLSANQAPLGTIVYKDTIPRRNSSSSSPPLSRKASALSNNKSKRGGGGGSKAGSRRPSRADNTNIVEHSPPVVIASRVIDSDIPRNKFEKQVAAEDRATDAANIAALRAIEQLIAKACDEFARINGRVRPKVSQALALSFTSSGAPIPPKSKSPAPEESTGDLSISHSHSHSHHHLGYEEEEGMRMFSPEPADLGEGESGGGGEGTVEESARLTHAKLEVAEFLAANCVQLSFEEPRYAERWRRSWIKGAELLFSLDLDLTTPFSFRNPGHLAQLAELFLCQTSADFHMALLRSGRPASSSRPSSEGTLEKSYQVFFRQIISDLPPPPNSKLKRQVLAAQQQTQQGLSKDFLSQNSHAIVGLSTESVLGTAFNLGQHVVEEGEDGGVVVNGVNVFIDKESAWRYKIALCRIIQHYAQLLSPHARASFEANVVGMLQKSEDPGLRTLADTLAPQQAAVGVAPQTTATVKAPQQVGNNKKIVMAYERAKIMSPSPLGATLTEEEVDQLDPHSIKAKNPRGFIVMTSDRTVRPLSASSTMSADSAPPTARLMSTLPKPQTPPAATTTISVTRPSTTMAKAPIELPPEPSGGAVGADVFGTVEQALLEQVKARLRPVDRSGVTPLELMTKQEILGEQVKLWTLLQVPKEERGALIKKYIALQEMDKTKRAFELWAAASEIVLVREHQLFELTRFDVSSPPIFPTERKPGGETGPEAAFLGAMERLEVQRQRSKMIAGLSKLAHRCEQMCKLLKRETGDDLTFQGTLYTDKMKADYSRLLFQLESLRMGGGPTNHMPADGRARTATATTTAAPTGPVSPERSVAKYASALDNVRPGGVLSVRDLKGSDHSKPPYVPGVALPRI